MRGQALSDIQNQDRAILHASCVSVAMRGLLIVGQSGAGKSGLALQMLALGAGLVADDRVQLRMTDGQAMAEAAPNIGGMIEARGIGLLRADAIGPVPVRFVVDLGQTESDRLPEPVTTVVLRQTVPLLRGDGVPNLAAALIQLLKSGRVSTEWPSK